MNVLRLHPEGGAPPIVIDQPSVRVGRDSACEVHLRDASVSRHHAEIEKRGDDWVIVDQKSGNGVRVDGKRTHEAVLLPGQQLHVGNLRFRVEIDRGDDGATLMLARSPLLEPETDRTLLAGGPPVFLEPELAPELEAESQPATRSLAVPIALVAVVLAGIALSVFAYRTIQRPKVTAGAPVRFPTPLPTPVATATPEPIPTPTPTPVPRPTGSLLVSTDVDARVSIDGRVVAELKAAGLRRFSVAPGEHIVRFIADSDGSQTEVVARVRVNEQTVVRRGGSSDVSPSATPTPTPMTMLPMTPLPAAVATPTPIRF